MYQVRRRTETRGHAHRNACARGPLRVPTCTAHDVGAHRRASGYAGEVPRSTGRPGRFLLLAALVGALVACSGEPAPSFDPTGPCAADGSAPGAYPELEARVPTSYRETAPDKLDSGRNCSLEKLGLLAELGFDEVRFAGATWGFGAERALVLAVFTAPGLDATEIADFYTESARTTPRMEILAEAEPTIAGRPGRRLDTKRVDRLQTIVVWPASEPDVVNVVVTNDLPDARITEAIDTFGDR
jgi:hypothetical protein